MNAASRPADGVQLMNHLLHGAEAEPWALRIVMALLVTGAWMLLGCAVRTGQPTRGVRPPGVPYPSTATLV